MRRERIRPDMNVTPLVDVVLVLLIIFMVVTPQMEAGAAVDLPGVEHPDPEVKVKQEPVTLSLTRAGTLYLEREQVERERLVEALARVHAEAPGRRMLLKADRGARYGEVRALFKLAQDVGFPGVSLQVGDRKQGGG